uniref:CDK5 regulatory subunit-associated protein 2 n=1 Tax=Amazona collaria TaxID=241587 RepID=A0A8B9IZG6_9PSIT
VCSSLVVLSGRERCFIFVWMSCAGINTFQITDLKKENFNLKLRIYFLEERMQQKFDGPTEEIYKINIELKVEIESLKRDLQEREKLLIKASKAVESLAQGGDAEMQRVKEEAQKKMQEMEEILTSRINLLEKDLKAAQGDVEKAVAMTEKEKALRIAAEQKLASIMNAPAKDDDMITGAEKDRLIEQLNLSLKSKEAIIQHLEEEKAQSGSYDENLSAEKIRELTNALRHEKDSEIEAIRMELTNERNSFEKKIQSLQEELQERENELAVEKKNGLKRDKTIQGLTVALKAKEKENEELGSEIEDLNASLAKAREATHKAHMQKFKGAADYQALLMEKETLLAELRSENLTKNAENHKLQRRIKRTDQELKDLNLEREKMEKELDEAQLQKSRSDKTINDLRNQLEKLHGEMTEKEQALEHHYNILLSESNQKLQSQELVIKQLTDNVSQKDLLLQENKEAEYEKLILALRKEQNIYSTLVKTFKESDSINSLQMELNNIFMLRKQLEEAVLDNRNLQKILEDQIKDIKTRQACTKLVFLQFAVMEKKFPFVLPLSINQELKKKQLGRCTTDSKETEALKILNHSEYSRQEQMKIVNELLDHLNATEEECSSEDMEKKDEKDLRQMIIQLKAELKHFKQVNKFLKQRVELQSASDGKEKLYRDAVPQINKDIELLKAELKDAVTQTMTLEGNVMRFKHEGEKGASEEKSKYSRLNAEREHQQENVCKKGEQHERLFSAMRTNESLTSLSRSSGNSFLKLVNSEVQVELNTNIHMQTSCFSDMQHHHSISDVNIQHSLKEINEEFYSTEHEGIDSAPAYSDSKCLRSLKLSVTSTDALDDCAVIEDIEEMKERIKNMKSELERYKMFVFHLQTSDQFLLNGVSNIALSDTALPVEGHVTQVQDRAAQGIKPFSSVHQLVDYENHPENRNSESSKAPDTWTAQNLKELLAADEAELEKEQIANTHLHEVCHLQNKLRETSPSNYDSLVHSQPREVSFQRQQMKEIRSGCVTYHQHLTSLIKAFEELLQASDVDYYVAEGFREQLNQSVLLFEKLEGQFLYGKDNEKNTAMYQQLKEESPVPSALHSLSDFDLSEKSSLGSPEPRHDLEGQHGTLALLPNKFPPELLMEHLQEIRILRQRLEYSIKTNERLRKQLERQVTDKELDQGSANIFNHGSEQHNSLTSEIHFLRKQNQVLNAMLAKGSRDKQKENEKLRESLSKKNAIIEHLHEDYECIKRENERLQKQIGQKEDETRYLTCQIYSSRNELNRLQTEINVKQHQFSENEKLLQSLRTEIKVYEKLEEARRKRTGINAHCFYTPSPSSKDDVDSISHCSSTSSSSTACAPRLVPGHRMWADKNGRHVLGLIEDYNALRKQISEGQQVLAEMEVPLKEISGTKLQEPGIKVPEQAALQSFSANIHTVQQILEEAARLLKLLWRVSLPLKGVHGTTHGTQVLLCFILGGGVWDLVGFVGWLWVVLLVWVSSFLLECVIWEKSFETYEPWMALATWIYSSHHRRLRLNACWLSITLHTEVFIYISIYIHFIVQR